MHPRIEELANAIREGDLDKTIKALFSVIREAEQTQNPRFVENVNANILRTCPWATR